MHKIRINRSNLIRLNDNKINQLKHDNTNNYWNFKEKNDQFYKSREMYYYNQIQHFKKDNTNGLDKVINSDIDYTKTIITINLKRWTHGVIKIFNKDSNKYIFEIITCPTFDTGILKIILETKNIELPINPEEKYPKIMIEIVNNNILFKHSYLFETNFKVNSKPNNVKLKYQNIELDFDNIYTPTNKIIKYNNLAIYKKKFYLNNIFF